MIFIKRQLNRSLSQLHREAQIQGPQFKTLYT